MYSRLLLAATVAVLLTATPAFASEITGTLTAGAGSTVTGTVATSSGGTLSGTVTSSPGGGLSGTVVAPSSGGGGGSSSGGGSSGGGSSGSVLGESTATPGLPNTGAGGAAGTNIALLLTTALTALVGLAYARFHVRP